MAEDNQNIEELIAELQRRNQQLEALRNAYQDLQNRERDVRRDQIINHVKHMPTFTGHGDITINSFIRNVDYYLAEINNVEARRAFILAIYHERIQGEAKSTVINVPQPDNWDLIKATLKLRYKPDIEPFQLYRRISSLKVNSVSELAIEIQQLKYKADELIIYHEGDNFINLSNISGILVNTIKEMTQGTLLERIYEENVLENILLIMRRRRYEDSCIRPEFTKNRVINKDSKRPTPNNFRQQNRDSNDLQYRSGNNYHNNQFPSNYYPNNSNPNNNQNHNRSGQNRRYYQQSGNNRNSGQYRQQYFNRQPEPMDVSNIQQGQVNTIERQVVQSDRTTLDHIRTKIAANRM